MPAIQEMGPEVLFRVATAGTPVSNPITPAALRFNNQVFVSNRTTGWVRVDFGTAAAVPSGSCVDASANGGSATGFSIGPGNQGVLTVPPGMTYGYVNSTVAGDIYVKPVSGV